MSAPGDSNSLFEAIRTVFRRENDRSLKMGGSSGSGRAAIFAAFTSESDRQIGERLVGEILAELDKGNSDA